MTDLKISQFTDGGAIQATDSIAAVRAGVNTKVVAGSAAAYDVGDLPGDIPVFDDLSGNPQYPPGDGSLLTGVSVSGSEQIGTSGMSLPSILFVGDSTVSQNDSIVFNATGVSNVSISRYGRAIGWIDRLAGGGAFNYQTAYDPSDNLRKGNNAGVGGDDMLEVYDRLVTGDLTTGGTPLLSRAEKYFFFQVGTNDLNAGVSLATLITRATNIITQCLASKKIPIMTTILPRNSADGANDWGATGTTQAQKRLILNSYNTWLKAYCADKNLICIPWDAVFSAADGQAVTGYTSDGLHPNNRGGYYLAKEALRVIGNLLGKSTAGQRNAYDAYDATYNPYGNVYNGDLSGTGGALVVGSGTGTVTGTVPDNFQLQKATSTTTNCAASIVARPDGLPGNAVRLDFTTFGTGNVSEEWRFNYWTGSTTSLASYANSDDIISTSCEFSVPTGHAGIVKSTTVRVAMNSGITRGPATTISFATADNSINDSAGLFAFLNNRVLNVAGSTSNNTVFKVLTQTASKLVCDPSTPVTAEAAGASITIRLPASTSASDASTEAMPLESTGTYAVTCAPFIVPNTASVTPRMSIFINGTLTGTATVYIMRPSLFKMPFKPALLNLTASGS